MKNGRKNTSGKEADRSESHAPRSGAAHQGKGQPSPGDEERRQRRPHDGADAERGVQKTDPRAADVQHPKRQHDEHNVHGALHDGVRAHERDDQPRPALAHEHPEATEQVGERRLILHARRRYAPGPDSGRQERGNEQRPRQDAEDHAGARYGEQHAGQGRPAEHAEALDPPRRCIGRR